jgi:hypothetical protein
MDLVPIIFAMNTKLSDKKTYDESTITYKFPAKGATYSYTGTKYTLKG